MPRYPAQGNSWSSQQCEAFIPNIANSNLKRQFIALLRILKAIEKVSKRRWRLTSWIRDSVSHSNGMSFDIAPFANPAEAPRYAHFKGSDPILTYRLELRLGLLKLSDMFPKDFPYDVKLFIETHHLHINLLPRSKESGHPRVTVWVYDLDDQYPDSKERRRLPVGYKLARNSTVGPKPIPGVQMMVLNDGSLAIPT